MSKRLQILLPDDLYQKLEDIADKKGTIFANGKINLTATVYVTIADIHARLFPEYVQAIKARNSQTTDDIAMKKIAEEDAKSGARERTERDKNVALCSLLDNSTIIQKEGRDYCQYPVYTQSSPHSVTESMVDEPLGLMNEELVSRQYTDIFNQTGPLIKVKMKKLFTKQNKPKAKK